MADRASGDVALIAGVVRPTEVGTASRWVVLLAVGVASYMSALDGSIVNAILPVLTLRLAADVATVQWVVTIYLLVQSGLLLTFGRLGDMVGHRRVYAAGLALFVLASALCGAAGSVGALIGARAVQAVGASMLIAGAPPLLTHAFPPSHRGRVLGWMAAAVYLGLASGPPLGGWLATVLDWRAVFLVNVPVGVVALALALRFVPGDAPSGRREPFDLAGAGVYVLGLVALLLALNQGHAWGWASAPVLGLAAAGLLLLWLFTGVERRAAAPMLDLGLFDRRAFSAPVLSAILHYMGISAAFFLVPFYLIQGRGLSPAEAGLILTAQPIVMAITASLAGAISDRFGSRRPATLGMVVVAAGLLLTSRLGDATPLAAVAVGLAVVGLGIGLFTTPNNAAVMAAVPAARRGVASGVLATARTLGVLLGVGMSGAIFSTVLASAAGDAPGTIAAVSVGLVAAAAIVLVGAVTSAARPDEHDPD
jgi:EmrB/QacA subfamily drug resistance transporter